MAEKAFIVEGAKSVREVIEAGYTIRFLLLTNSFKERNEKLIQLISGEIIMVTDTQLAKVGHYQTNNSALAVVETRDSKPPQISKNEYVLVLDEVKDPGNLGTIIRLADWYNIQHIVCTANSVDGYNPKVIQSSMGSFARVTLFYTDLSHWITQQDRSIPVYGTFLDGQNVHHCEFASGGLIIMGNESSGISKELEEMVQYRISIPRYGHAESLNVAMATAIIMDNVRRTTS